MNDRENTKESGAINERKLGITSWYVNIHRVLEAIGVQNLPPGLMETLKEIANHPLHKSFLISELSPVLVDWVSREKIPSLEELLLKGRLQKGAVFTFDGKLASRGLAVDNPGDAVLRLSLKEFNDPRPLIIKFHADNLTTSSARSALMGQPSVFVIAYIDSLQDDEISCRPYVIGDLVQKYRHGIDLRYRDSLELRPEKLDALRDVDFTQRMSKADLDVLKSVSEATVKHAFAKIIGEPDVPKDWGGEECDLFSANLLIDGQRTTGAFAFKGPSKFKPMECSDCGKNGDQIVRLFGAGAEISILQHCHKIQPAVRKTMAAFARGNLSERRRYCVIDGYDTVKILRHFKYLN
jgi:hypothetical protein